MPSAFDRYAPTAILTVVSGSHGYGLARPDSDLDLRGVFLAPCDDLWSLGGVPDQIEASPPSDTVYWELRRFCTLALKANPTVLETLWAQPCAPTTPLGIELQAIRAAFLSRRVVATYGGYARQQMYRARTTHRSGSGPMDAKYAMHLVRLLCAGIHVLRTGDVLVEVGSPLRETLLSVRAGEWTWDAVLGESERLDAALSQAAAETRLPAVPDTETVDRFLLRCRRVAAGIERL